MEVMNMTYWEKNDLAKMLTADRSDLLRELSADENDAIRCSVASNPNTPKDILKELLTDDYSRVRICIIWNPNASREILVMLFAYEKNLKDPNEEVIRALYLNETLPLFAKRIIETLFGEML